MLKITLEPLLALSVVWGNQNDIVTFIRAYQRYGDFWQRITYFKIFTTFIEPVLVCVKSYIQIQFELNPETFGICEKMSFVLGGGGRILRLFLGKHVRPARLKHPIGVVIIPSFEWQTEKHLSWHYFVLDLCEKNIPFITFFADLGP